MNGDEEYKPMNDDDITKTTEGLLFNPFNHTNKKIKLNEVQSILKKYGLPGTVNNIALYERAFVHKSYTKRPFFENEQNDITIAEQPFNCLPLSSKSNERLEFLGDGVLECITKYYLYRRFPKANEGFMTEKKIALVKNESIGKLAYEIGLHNWLMISAHAEEKKIRTNLKKLGCLFESFLGALFLDFNKINVNDSEGWWKSLFVTGPGFQMAQKFVENVFENHIDWVKLIKTDDNYKNILQIKIQKEFKTTPQYLEVNYDIEKGYTTGVYLCLGQNIHNLTHNDSIRYKHLNSFKEINNYLDKHEKAFIFLGEGTHKIKKKAEQISCENALKIIGY